MKILIVEDEPSLCELMARTLRKEQYVVETASTFTEASERLGVYSYDCVLLDIMLPDGNGLRLLEELKMQDKRENVIIISARDSLEDKILGLEEGADDYLPKPFHMAELSARIRSVVRRSRGSGRSSIVLGNVTLDPESFRVEVAGAEVVLLKRVRHTVLSHATAGAHGGQGRTGRGRVGRPCRPGGQFPFCLFPDEKPAAQT